jgi:MFS family permease
MLALLKKRNYALLWSGSLLSQIGTYMLMAALPYFVYQTAHSVTASGLTFVSEALPSVLCNTIGGVYADRLPRKAVLAAGNGVRGLLLLPLLAVHAPSTLWIVYVTGFLSSALAAFAGPFGNAALPHIVSSAELPAANGGFSLATNAAVLLGSPLGGIVLQRFGLAPVVAVDVVSFVAPTVSILLIDVPLQDQRTQESAGGAARPGVLREWLLGWAYARTTPLLVRLYTVAIPTFFASSVIGVVLVPFVRRVLGGSAEFYSWTLTGQALSSIAAAAVIGRVSRIVSPGRLLGASLLVLGVTAGVEVAAVAQPVTLAAAILLGFPILFVDVGLTTLLQAGTDDAYRGRVYGSYISTVALVSLTGAGLATAVTDHVGIRPVFALGGGLLAIAGLVAWRVLPREQ